MRTTILLFFTLLFTSCERTDKAYKRTSISLPSNQAIYTAGTEIDSISKELTPSAECIPKSILNYLTKNFEAQINKPISEEIKLEKANYQLDNGISIFEVTANSKEANFAANYVGIYKNGNFDFFTSIYQDSVELDLELELTKFEQLDEEYLVTSKTVLNGAINFQRMTFKDTLDQLLWYKIEL